MPQEPKKRHSRQRQGKRRAAIHLQTVKGMICSNCGNITFSHQVCKICGYYKKKQIIVLKVKKKKKEPSV